MNEDTGLDEIGLDEIGFEDDDDLLEPAWWAPASLLSPEASAITAFTLAILGMFGGATIGAVLVQSIVEAPWDQDRWGWYAVLSAGVALLFALGAVVLARKVLVGGDGPDWSRHLAHSAVIVAAASVALSALTVVSGAVRASPGA